MRKKHSIFVTFLLLTICFTPFLPAKKQETTSGIHALDAPPHAFTTNHIRRVRETAKRVGWTDLTIDNQIVESEIQEVQAWNQCVKAAILGGTETIQKTSFSFIKTTENHLLNATFSPANTFLLLQTYDCLHAIPEYSQIPEDLQKRLRSNIRDLTQILFEELIGNPALQKNILYRSNCLYAGMINGTSEQISLALDGNQTIQPLKHILRTQFTNEGLLLKATLAEHISTCSALLQAGKAFKNIDAERFSPFHPLLQRTADIICELAYPSGNLPYSAQNTIGRDTVLFLERANSIFKNPKYGFILNKFYKDNIRSGEALLLGASSIESKEVTLHSKPFPQSGVAMLHNVESDLPISVFFDTGLSLSMNRTSLLSMQLSSNSFANKPLELDMPTINTVLVDRTRQSKETKNSPLTAIISSFVPFEEESTYVSAYASGQYTSRKAYRDEDVSTPVSMYQRNIYAAPPYVLDLFRVQGGEIHDYFYVGSGNLHTSFDEKLTSFQPETGDYESWKQSNISLASTKLKDNYFFDFKPDVEENPSERMWVVDPAGSEVTLSKNPGRPMVVLRRNAAGNLGDLFISVHEIFRNETPDTTIFRLPLSPSGNERDYQATAVVAERKNQFDIFLSALRPDYTYEAEYKGGKLIFSGSFGHIRFKHGELHSLRLIGGSMLRYDTYGVQLAETTNIGVVHSVNSAQNEIKTRFPYPIPTGLTLFGNLMMALASDEYPVLFQPLVIDRIPSNESPQTVQLRFGHNLSSPHPQLAPPLLAGDQILHENFAELKYLNKDHFRLTTTVNTNVILDGRNDTHRVLFRGASLMRRIRGDSVAGVITFPVHVEETLDGKVEFVRMP